MSMNELLNIEASPAELTNRLISAETDIEIALEMIKLIGDADNYEALTKVREMLAYFSHYYSDEFCDFYE